MNQLATFRSALSKYDYVRFSLIDLNGTSRGLWVPSRHAYRSLEQGLTMYEGAVLAGSAHCEKVLEEKFPHHKCMKLFPDPESLRWLPWSGGKDTAVCELMCESRWIQDNSPQEACPRYTARRQIQKLHEMGFQVLTGTEMEFLMLDANSLEPVCDGFKPYCNREVNKYSEVLTGFETSLHKAGVDIQKIHAEDIKSSFEFVLAPKLGIEGPDSVVTLKQGLKEMSDKHKQFRVTFLSSLSLDTVYDGPAAHLNLSLVSKESNRNMFYDEDDPLKLSKVAKHWIAGVLRHSRSLTALMAPTPNCYRGLHGLLTPSTVYWGLDNRKALIRVKNFDPSTTYMELRLPTANSNPYLVLAGTIAAGMDGLANELELAAPGQIVNVLPKTLQEALEVFENDTGFRELLGEELVSWYLLAKKADLEEIDSCKTEEEKLKLEKKLYF